MPSTSEHTNARLRHHSEVFTGSFLCLVGATTRVDERLRRLPGLRIGRGRGPRHRRHAQRQVEGRAARGRIDIMVSKYRSAARPAHVLGVGYRHLIGPPGMIRAVCEPRTRTVRICRATTANILCVVPENDIRATTAIVVHPRVKASLYHPLSSPCVALRWPERENQSDDFRR